MTTSVALTDLAGPALVRAFNDLAGRVGQEPVKRFSDRAAGVKRATKLLETHFANCEVSLTADGVVSVMACRQPSVTETPAEPAADLLVSEPPVAEPELAPGERTALLDAAQRQAFASTERRVSPGLARMQARLGSEGTEALRQQVVGDSEAALAAAATRSGATVPVQADPSPRPADSPATSPVVAKATKATKPAKPAARPSGRAPLFADTDLIRYLLVDSAPNPKRGTAAVRFAHYRDGMTVADYITAVGDRKQALRDLAWDTKQKWVGVEGAKSSTTSAGK